MADTAWLSAAAGDALGPVYHWTFAAPQQTAAAAATATASLQGGARRGSVEAPPQLELWSSHLARRGSLALRLLTQQRRQEMWEALIRCEPICGVVSKAPVERSVEEQSEVRRRLAALPEFAGADDAALRRLAEHAAMLWFTAEGEAVFEQGDPADSLLVVLHGEVRLWSAPLSSSSSSPSSAPAPFISLGRGAVIEAHARLPRPFGCRTAAGNTALLALPAERVAHELGPAQRARAVALIRFLRLRVAAFEGWALRDLERVAHHFVCKRVGSDAARTAICNAGEVPTALLVVRAGACSAVGQLREEIREGGEVDLPAVVLGLPHLSTVEPAADGAVELLAISRHAFLEASPPKLLAALSLKCRERNRRDRHFLLLRGDAAVADADAADAAAADTAAAAAARPSDEPRASGAADGNASLPLPLPQLPPLSRFHFRPSPPAAAGPASARRAGSDAPGGANVGARLVSRALLSVLSPREDKQGLLAVRDDGELQAFAELEAAWAARVEGEARARGGGGDEEAASETKSEAPRAEGGGEAKDAAALLTPRVSGRSVGSVVRFAPAPSRRSRMASRRGGGGGGGGQVAAKTQLKLRPLEFTRKEFKGAYTPKVIH